MNLKGNFCFLSFFKFIRLKKCHAVTKYMYVKSKEDCELKLLKQK